MYETRQRKERVSRRIDGGGMRQMTKKMQISTCGIDTLIQKQATIRSKSLNLEPRILNTELNNDIIVVKANPEFAANFGYIKNLSGGNIIKGRSNRKNHSEPILINSFYNSNKEDWESADNKTLECHNTPSFYLFTERKPCKKLCLEHLKKDIYQSTSIVEYCDGISNTTHIMDNYRQQAIEQAKSAYGKEYNFSNITILYETKYPGKICISGIYKNEETIKNKENQGNAKPTMTFPPQSDVNHFYYLKSDDDEQNENIEENDSQIAQHQEQTNEQGQETEVKVLQIAQPQEHTNNKFPLKTWRFLKFLAGILGVLGISSVGYYLAKKIPVPADL